MVLHLTSSDDPPRVDPLAKFFAMAWRDFCRYQQWEGPDLEHAIEEAGLGEWREATDAEGEYQIGDRIIVLTDAGRAAIAAAKRGT